MFKLFCPAPSWASLLADQGQLDRLVAAPQGEIQADGYQDKANDGKGQHEAPQLSWLVSVWSDLKQAPG